MNPTLGAALSAFLLSLLMGWEVEATPPADAGVEAGIGVSHHSRELEQVRFSFNFNLDFGDPEPAVIPPLLIDGEGNSYPIILVPGFLGWSRGDLGPLLHFGGTNRDIERDLRDAGHKAFTGMPGPVASNWDRAAELFASIKGGTVDYGAVHSAKYGHERFGTTFDGLYPEWGTEDADGNVRKVHLVAHSMGGQTSRLLTHLLNNGASSEGNGSVLFQGANDWVASVTTLCTPHDGSSLAAVVKEFLPNVQELALGFVALAGLNSGEALLYDFKLDQWGLRRSPGESFASYLDRIMDSDVWDTEDFSAFDLCPDGAKVFNQAVPAVEHVFYFSWGAEATFPNFITGHHLPELDNMIPLLHPTALLMGVYTRFELGKVVIDEDWWLNDGVVNVISMARPSQGSSDEWLQFDGTPRRGVWNVMKLMEHWDHFTFVGLNLQHQFGEDFYLDWAEFLQKLPR